jgi:hypothetical protein
MSRDKMKYHDRAMEHSLQVFVIDSCLSNDNLICSLKVGHQKCYLP